MRSPLPACERSTDAQAQLDDVSKARPEITKAVEAMVSKGKWTVPGYVESESLRCALGEVERELTDFRLRRVRSACCPPCYPFAEPC